MTLRQTIESLRVSVKAHGKRASEYIASSQELWPAWKILESELASLWFQLEFLHTHVLEPDDCYGKLDELSLEFVPGYISLLDSIDGLDTPVSVIQDAAAATMGYAASLGLAHDTSSTVRDLVFHLELLNNRGFRDESIAIANASQMASSIPDLSGLEDGQEPTSADVARWLAVFNSPAFNRVPDNYFQEELTRRCLRAIQPNYLEAATQWPAYAELYWPALQSQACTLFRSPVSSNFVRWAVEYAQHICYDLYGDNYDHYWDVFILDTLDCLLDGSIKPLHFAAAMGLPSLCSALIAETGHSPKSTKYGTPLFCALLGPSALTARYATVFPYPFQVTLGDDIKARRDTISVLLDAGTDCSYEYQWGKDHASMASVAFWTALHVNDASIFTRVIHAGAALDRPMFLLIRYLEHDEHTRTTMSIILRTLTIAVFDILLSTSDTETHAKIRLAIEQLFPTFAALRPVDGNDLPVQEIDDEEFFSILSTNVSCGDLFAVQRLALDPRFKHHMKADGYSMLDLAVESDMVDMVELLLKEGAEISEGDDDHRPTLMRVEGRDMLSKLVLGWDADTTVVDRDGRNIWHFMAGSNDIGCLQWLSLNDPNKEENLKTKAVDGNTPLADAFFFVDDLIREGRTPMSVQPAAAMLLLMECTDAAYLSSRTPLPCLAAAWGHIDLIEGLVTAGADFKALDFMGASPLHHLNVVASPEAVARLQELCAGAPISCMRNHTPADSFIANSIMRIKAADDPLPPKIWRSAQKAFSLLVTDEMVAHRSPDGECFWVRYADYVFQRKFFGKWKSLKMRESFWQFMLHTVKCVASHGALRAYEAEKDLCAASVFEAFHPGHNHHIQWILENSQESYQRPLVAKYSQTNAARKLLADEAEHAASTELILLLVGMAVPCDGEIKEGWTVLELAFRSRKASLEKAKIIVPHIHSGSIQERQGKITLALTRNLEKPEIIRLLVAEGLLRPGMGQYADQLLRAV